MVTEDDSWAEAELERQLAALTPIDCIEDAQNKFINDFHYIEEESAIPEEEEGLPPSVELYISKLQEQVTQLDQELYECENLIQYQTGGSEFIEELEEDEFFEDVLEEGLQEEEWLKHGVHYQDGEEGDSSEENDIAKVFEMTVKYCMKVKPDLSPKTPDKPQEQNEEIFRDVREQKRAEQLQELERERKRMEQLQQDQMFKLEEEVRLAEAELLKEVQHHEAKLAAMEEQSRLELAEYEAERRRTKERLEKRNNEAAVRIQAHFKGMRTRNQYGVIVKEKIAKKREEILKEQLAKYEQIIEEEKAAVEWDIREKERKAERERDLKKKHSEKELKRSEQERKKEAERLAKEIQKKVEEEERLRVETEQELHWNQSSNMDKLSVIRTVELDNESVSSEVLINPTTSLIRDSQISFIDEDVIMEDLSGMPVEEDNNDGDVVACVHTTFSDCLDYIVDQVDNDKEEVNENSMRESSNLNMAREATEILNREVTDNEMKRRRKKSAKDSSTQETSTDTEPRRNIPSPSPRTTLTPVPPIPSKSIEVERSVPKPQEKPSILFSLANKAKNFFRRTEEANVEQSQAILAELERVEDCTEAKTKETMDCTDLPMSSSLKELSYPQENALPSKEGLGAPLQEVASLKNSSQPATDTPASKPLKEMSFPPQDEVSSRTSPKPRISKLKKDLDVAKSFDSSSRPSSSQRVTPPTAQSLDLEEERKKKRKAASNNARSEYRRRRKVKEISSNPMESPSIFSPLTRSPTHFSTFNTPTPPPPLAPVINITGQELLNFRVPSIPDTVNREVQWDTFNTAVEELHAEWQAQGKVWDQEPAPPRQGTAHVPSVCNEWRHEGGPCIQDQAQFRLTNTECNSVVVRRCKMFVVSNVYSNSMGDDNTLQIEDCKEMTLSLARSSLHSLSVVRGDLTTVPKLCQELVTLDLSYNSITRVDPAPCRLLTSLNLSHNKLRSTRGLASLPHLLTLDLSNNCITSLQGIGNLSVLQSLNLSQNQLAQCPVLDNHILLSTLCLAGNGFTDVASLEMAWLPSLEQLDISSNGLTTLPPLYKICPFLTSLNISYNMLDTLIEALQFLLLDVLQCEGNSDCMKGAEFLEYDIDSIDTNEKSELCLFGKLCVAQRTSRKDLANHLSEYSCVERNRAQLIASLKHRAQLVTYGLQHQTEKMLDELTRCDLPTKQDAPPSPPVVVPTVKSEHSQHSEESEVKLEQKCGVTATKDNTEDQVLWIQCLARGYLARQALQHQLKRRRDEFITMFRASVVIQARWRGFWCRKIMGPFCPWVSRRMRKKEAQYKAAVLIQSRFRGYILRKKLSCLMEQTQYELDDIDFAEKIPDFGEFDFDEEAVEKGWDLPPTPQLPANNTPIPNTPHSVYSVQSALLSSPVPLLPLRRVSATGGSEISLLSLPPSRVNSKPPSARSNSSDYSARTTERSSQRANAKQHDLQEEWGMSQHTADLLLRRSRRFGDKMTDVRKKEIVRKKIAAMRKPLQRTPPPPTSNNSLVDLVEVDEGIHYEWTMNPVQHAKRLVNSQQRPENAGRKAPSQLASGHRKAEALHVQMYKNPSFSSPSSEGGSNVKLPPLLRLNKKGHDYRLQ